MDAFTSSFLGTLPWTATAVPTCPIGHRRRHQLISISAVVTRTAGEKTSSASVADLDQLNHIDQQHQQQQQQQQQLYDCTTAPASVTPASNSKTTTGRSTTAAPQRRRQTPSSRGTPSIAATVCSALDAFIDAFIDSPPRPSVDPRYVLSGNFAPVEELPPVPCPVVRGSIPPCLRGGAYIRNGPNPQYLPRGPHHLFDGDGMLHSILLPTTSTAAGGREPAASATLCSRFVHTYRYTVERDAGAPVLPSAFSAFSGLAGVARGAVTAAKILTGQANPLQGIGQANTSLFHFANRIYALGESDLPYAVHVSPDKGDVLTVGRCDFDGKISTGMTAHPKKDPATGEVFAFRYGPVPPFLTYFRFDRFGNKMNDVPVFSVRQPSFFHDFAITSRYAIFPDIQIVMNPANMVFGDGSPVGVDPSKVPRVGLLPRYATSESEMRWFQVPGFNPVHTINAWDVEGEDAVVLVAANVLSVEHALERTELVHSCVEMVRIDLKDGGTVTRTPLSALNLDFGVINVKYTGRKNRYAYMGVGGPMPKISGVVKLDFEAVMARNTGIESSSSSCTTSDCVVARRNYGEGCFGGEPFFVPSGAEEDEGYLVTYVHDEKKGESRFLVMDARSPGLDTVAEVLLPRRVPYGFHGLFVGADELNNQTTS